MGGSLCLSKKVTFWWPFSTGCEEQAYACSSLAFTQPMQACTAAVAPSATAVAT